PASILHSKSPRTKVIPHIIHQSWKNQTLPKKFARWADSWKQHHPDWIYILWTDEMNRDLVQREFPWFLSTYDALPHNINRADAARYLYMYQYGGVYADLDMECLRAMDAPVDEGEPALIDRGAALIGRMGHNTRFEHSLPNAWMASSPGHPFWLVVVNLIVKNLGTPEGDSAEKLTGPVALYKAWAQFSHRLFHEDFVVLPHGYIYPYDWNQALVHGAICSAQSNTFDEVQCKRILEAEGEPGQPAYTITYWSHSW
ncbi:nucleotide-diphospho-sugar transferase, partial [Polychytrium aggregatum]|uniref:nucleotide-diphospho-sugar transferase n=1 Tax=Polychytrium aggregatum TaxID=110093 RepID=UPI0022FE966E